jgi:hypothetical protein
MGELADTLAGQCTLLVPKLSEGYFVTMRWSGLIKWVEFITIRFKCLVSRVVSMGRCNTFLKFTRRSLKT